MNADRPSHRNWPLWALSAVLGLLATAYISFGFYYLVAVETAAYDLDSRWFEVHVFLEYALRAFNGADGVTAADLAGLSRSGYLPGSIVTGILFLWPDWPEARFYFAFLNGLAVLMVAGFVWRMGRGYGRHGAWFLVCSCLAVSSFGPTFAAGQYGVIVLGCIVVAVAAQERGYPVIAGLALGVAMVKPSLSIPFLFPFLVRRRWIALGVAAGYTIVTTGLFLAVARTDLASMVGDVGSAAADSTGIGTGIITTVAEPEGNSTKMIYAFAAGGLALGGCLTYVFRNRGLPILLAIAAVTARLWTYHRRYDNVILMFLILALAWYLLERRSNPTRFVTFQRWLLMPSFLLVGLSLWLPRRVFGEWEMVQPAMWIIGLAVLLAISLDLSKAKSEVCHEPDCG